MSIFGILKSARWLPQGTVGDRQGLIWLDLPGDVWSMEMDLPGYGVSTDVPIGSVWSLRLTAHSPTTEMRGMVTLYEAPLGLKNAAEFRKILWERMLESFSEEGWKVAHRKFSGRGKAALVEFVIQDKERGVQKHKLATFVQEGFVAHLDFFKGRWNPEDEVSFQRVLASVRFVKKSSERKR